MSKKTIFIIGSIIGVLTLIGLVFIFTAGKKVKTYTVSFETNGGTAVDSQVVNEGEVVIKPEDPIKEGYLFIQWLYQGTTYDFSSVVNSDLVLTAEWTEKEENVENYVVVFNSDGGTTIPNQIIEKGNKVQKPEDPIKNGYKFKCWVLNEIEYNFETIVQNNLELKALWEKVKTKNDKPVNNSANTNKPSNGGTNNNSNNNSNNNNNNTYQLKAPKIKYEEAGKNGDNVTYDISIDYESYREGNKNILSGWELYVTSDNAKGDEMYIDGVGYFKHSTNGNETIRPADVGYGNTYRYRARVYIDTANGRIYSNWSNIIEITPKK